LQVKHVLDNISYTNRSRMLHRIFGISGEADWPGKKQQIYQPNRKSGKCRI